jgi:histone H3/H4
MDIAISHENVTCRLEAVGDICTRISNANHKQIFHFLEFLLISDESALMKSYCYKYLKQYFPRKKLRSVKGQEPVFDLDSITNFMEVNGAENVDHSAVCSLIIYLDELLHEVIERSIDLARHEGRKTVLGRFVDIAISIVVHHRISESITMRRKKNHYERIKSLNRQNDIH